MLTVGACYLKVYPDRGPTFCQYLYNIIEAEKDFAFSAVMKYDRQFRAFREHHPTHSWAKDIWNYRLKMGLNSKKSVQGNFQNSQAVANFAYQSPVNRVASFKPPQFQPNSFAQGGC